MSLKPSANIALAATLILGAAALGAWLGQTAGPAIATSAASASPATQTAGPKVALPRPLASDTPEETFLAEPQAAAAPAPAIIPGGAVAGNAVQRMWEASANLAWQVRATPITPPNWYITGVVQRGDKTQIIVQFDGEPAPRLLKLGDVLPGGGKLAWVRPGAIGVITPNRKRLGVPVLSGDQEPGAALSAGPGGAPSVKAPKPPAR
jgi:hypothetical protein